MSNPAILKILNKYNDRPIIRNILFYCDNKRFKIKYFNEMDYEEFLDMLNACGLQYAGSKKNIISKICDQYFGICMSNISYISPYIDEIKLVSTIVHEFIHFIRGGYIVWEYYYSTENAFIEECLAVIAEEYFVGNTNIEKIIEISNKHTRLDIYTSRKLANECVNLFKKDYEKLFVDENHTIFFNNQYIVGPKIFYIFRFIYSFLNNINYLRL